MTGCGEFMKDIPMFIKNGEKKVILKLCELKKLTDVSPTYMKDIDFINRKEKIHLLIKELKNFINSFTKYTFEEFLRIL